MDEWTSEVPMAVRERFTEIVDLTDDFCEKHLNDEYKEICRKMAVAVCQKGAAVGRGKSASWACGIVYSAGWVRGNGLFDFLFRPANGFPVHRAVLCPLTRLRHHVQRLGDRGRH